MMKVYLAGGMKTNWQDTVKTECCKIGFIFFNPMDHECNMPLEYVNWDIHHVKHCDILFGYMEKDNPSGLGLAVEVGVAYQAGKTIILVDEKSNIDYTTKRQMSMVHHISNIVYPDLKSGIKYLKKFK